MLLALPAESNLLLIFFTNKRWGKNICQINSCIPGIMGYVNFSSNEITFCIIAATPPIAFRFPNSVAQVSTVGCGLKEEWLESSFRVLVLPLQIYFLQSWLKLCLLDPPGMDQMVLNDKFISTSLSFWIFIYSKPGKVGTFN